MEGGERGSVWDGRKLAERVRGELGLGAEEDAEGERAEEEEVVDSERVKPIRTEAGATHRLET